MASPARTPKISKSSLKAALAETLEENRDLVKELLSEAVEDLAFGKAIREGLKSRKVSKALVLSALGTSRK